MVVGRLYWVLCTKLTLNTSVCYSWLLFICKIDVFVLVTETGSEDDGLLDPSEDDFFVNGSSSDEADADDEWTDKSARYLSKLWIVA